MKTKKYLYSLFTVIWYITFANTAFGQEINVRGSITDSKGNPLPGVNIIVRSTQYGTITDQNGMYLISGINPYDTIIISSIGFESAVLPVKNRTEINVVLNENITGLEEVVIIGYGSVKKTDITGSVSVVKTDDLAPQSASKLSDMLQGRVAGLQIVKSSDDPNAGATIRIRGSSSFSGSKSPLIVIDGFPFGNDLGDLKQINPDNIASVEVLKDASASAIYGSQGANGVILISTKSGTEGKHSIFIKNQISVGQFDSKFITWRDPALMAILHNEGRENAGFVPYYIGAVNTGIYYPSVVEIQTGEWPYYTDWTKEVFNDYAVTENITIGGSGGDSDTKYIFTVNYWDQQGNIKGNDYKRLNVFASVDQQLKKNISLKFNSHITTTNTNNAVGTDYGRNPLWPVYIDNDPSLGYYTTSEVDIGNPVMRRDLITDKSKTLDLIGSGMLTWKITSQLTFKSTFSNKFGTSVTDKYTPDILEKTYNGVGSINNYWGNNLSTENFLTYEILSDKHQFTLMGGWTYEKNMHRTSYLEGRDFINDALSNEALTLSDPSNRIIENDLVETGLESVYGRANYSFLDKYLATFTTRADGSTKFGSNNKWGFFPSGAVSWKMHKESFMSNLEFINELKPRISYGLTGNQGVNPYQTLAQYGEQLFFDGTDWRPVVGSGYGVSGERFTEWWGIPSRDLKWETTSQLNIGLDMGMMDNRLKINFDYYYKHTTKLIRRKILPPSSAFDYMSVNDGVIDNKGIEILIDYVAIHTSDFKFTPTLTFTRNRNKVIDIGTTADAGLVEDELGLVYLAGRNDLEDYFGSNLVSIYAIGQPMLCFYGYRTDGIIQTEEEGLEAGLEGVWAQPGEIKYVDISDDGEIDDRDREIIGNPEPDFISSLNLAFEYKKFDLSVYMYGVYGNDILDAPKFTRANEQPFRWTPDNPTNDWSSLRHDRGWPKVSDWYITDGSYLRIQNISAGYKTAIEKLNISNLRIYMNVNNLYVFTKYKGYDPEVGLEGINWGGKPRQRTATLGVELTF